MDVSGFEWDESKRARNLAKHGLDFVLVRRFDWLAAKVYRDERFDYGEARFQAFGMMDGRACVVVFTRRGDMIRVIGMRRANRREIRRHGLGQKAHPG